MTLLTAAGHRRPGPAGWTFGFNVAGQASVALVQLAFVPLYLRLLGMEAFGLIGFYAAVFGISQLFDLGLGATINRTLAAERDGGPEQARAAFGSFETAAWTLAAIFGVTVYLCAELITSRWLAASQLSQAEVAGAVRLMAIVLVMQWPLNFYHGALWGLQRPAVLNSIRIAFAILLHAATALVLLRFEASVGAFFMTHAVVQALHVTALAVAVRLVLPGRGRLRRNFGELRRRAGFALGLSGVSVAAVILSYADKVVLTKLLPLDAFGVYALAWLAVSALSVLNVPMFNTIYPRFAAHVGGGDTAALRHEYRSAARAYAAVIGPVALGAALFAPELLRAWTGSAAIAQAAAPLAAILVLGAACSGLWNQAYALQLAHGWTRLAAMLCGGLALLVVPALLLLVPRMGAIAAAYCWLAINLTLLVVGVPLTHRRVLRGEVVGWFAQLVRPTCTALAVLLPARWLVGSGVPPWTGVAAAATAIIAALLVTVRPALRGASSWRPGESAA